ncbi:hypothetical protein D9611_006157 [Ephemerocybe angulata]|uniref:RNase H type-1 domain-containing protein n=1 Tax=Ephemerocybe angulata TaxID=980116 RepID=A0A8H5FKZ1_9AGAR|nr:hypothetical protein D9611_006157 [Tulosesus angulatus]
MPSLYARSTHTQPPPRCVHARQVGITFDDFQLVRIGPFPFNPQLSILETLRGHLRAVGWPPGFNHLPNCTILISDISDAWADVDARSIVVRAKTKVRGRQLMEIWNMFVRGGVQACANAVAATFTPENYVGSTSPDPEACTVSVRSWNIKGNFAIRMACSEFVEEIYRYDVNIFQETQMAKEWMGVVVDVPGYTRWSLEREYYGETRHQGGGVVALVREGVGLKMSTALSSPDILVLESPEMVVIGAYILPEGSVWHTFTEESPYECLEDLMAICRASGKLVVVVGDLNARTGESGQRTSADKVTSPRGNALLRACDANEMHILNGLPRFDESSRRKAVVDYAIGNERALAAVANLKIGLERRMWSDHAEIVLNLRVDGRPPLVRRRAKDITRAPRKRMRKPTLPVSTELDRLMVQAVESQLTPDNALRRLYGPVFKETSPIHIYVDGSGIDNGTSRARAGSGVFFGPGSKKNLAVRVPDEQTNGRAEVYAILRALQATHRHQTLVIYSDSEYVIGMVTTWAARKAAIGWQVTNGDILRDIAGLLEERPAAVTFKKVKAHSGNAHNDAADALAKNSADSLPVPSYEPMDWKLRRVDPAGCCCEPCRSKGPILSRDKVRSELGERRGHEGDPTYGKETPADIESALNVAAGHARCRERQREIRMELLNAPTDKEFWQVYKRLWSARAFEESEFTADDLRRVFEERMNPIMPTPASFDQDRLHLNEDAEALLVGDSVDATPLQSFSRVVVMEDIEKAKLRLVGRLDSAAGEDQISYREIMGMDNELLLALCNRCLELKSAPSAWLRTQLVGLLKKDKPKGDPASYRTIGLESCFLKFMMSVVTRRVEEWAESRGALPGSQNGFRKGYRTNNNVLVLQAAVDKAKAQGRPLYAVFVDLTNAFPSAHHATLWLKLRRLGAGGRMFDWLRWIYGEMTYFVLHDGEKSDEFKSSVGILIGDTCSPILWALYMSDLPGFMSRDDGDVSLDGISVTNVEQADDVLLLSMSREGLRRKVEGISRWCQVNFMLFNETKSVVLVFGGKASAGDREPLEFGEGCQLQVVKEVSYLGFLITSTGSSGPLRKHYTVKAQCHEHGIRMCINTTVHLSSQAGYSAFLA